MTRSPNAHVRTLTNTTLLTYLFTYLLACLLAYLLTYLLNLLTYLLYHPTTSQASQTNLYKHVYMWRTDWNDADQLEDVFVVERGHDLDLLAEVATRLRRGFVLEQLHCNETFLWRVIRQFTCNEMFILCLSFLRNYRKSRAHVLLRWPRNIAQVEFSLSSEGATLQRTLSQ